MAGDKYIHNVGGTMTEVASLQSSAGVADAGKIPALDATGKIDLTMLPPGVAPNTSVLVASEALSGGAFVNVYDDAGTPSVRNADATTGGKEAHGYVLTAVASAANATVYFNGANGGVTGATGGVQYLAIVPGTMSNTPPSGAGNVVQRLGVATSATSMNFEATIPVVLA